MKLPILPGVLFDEFPTDKSVKYCFLTQPKFPTEDYCQYSENVIYCGSMATLFVMSAFQRTSPMKTLVLTEWKSTIQLSATKKFSIRALSTDSIGADPVMFLIYIGDAIHMYTGQFSKCREVVLNKLISYNISRINDIYVDNATAGLRQPCLLKEACSQIKQIVSAHEGYTIVLHIEPFGYEALLYELARNNIKFELNEIHKYMFEHVGLANVFEYDGEPNMKLWVRFKDEVGFATRDYKRFFERQKIIHVKLVVCQHEFHRREKVDGLFLVPYTPHANAFELFTLFHAVRPKRVYPIIKRSYADDQLSTIPLDLLNDDCEIVGGDDFPEDVKIEEERSQRSFLQISEFSEDLGELSDVEVSDPIHDLCTDDDDDDDDELSHKSKHQTATKSPQTNKKQPTVPVSTSKPVAFIEIDDNDDEDKDNDDIFSFETRANPESPPKATEKAIVVTDTNEQNTDPSGNEPKTSSEGPVQQNQRDTVISAPAPTKETTDANAVQNIAPSTQPTGKCNDANNNQPADTQKQQQQQSSVASTTTTATAITITTPTANRRLSRWSGVGGNKRRFMKQLRPIHRDQPIQYLPSSDEDDDNDDDRRDVSNKRLRLNEKENKQSPAKNGVQTNVNNQINQPNVRRLSQIDDNVIRTGNASSSCQHGVPAIDSHSNRQKVNDNRNTNQNNQTEKTATEAVRIQQQQQQ